VDKWIDYEVVLPADVLEKFWQPLMKRLKDQAALLPDASNYLASSDIIESSARIGAMDAQTIQQALEANKIEDVQNWFATQRAGPSFLTKRKQALRTTKKPPKKKGQPVQKIKRPPDKVIQIGSLPKELLKTG